MENYEQFSYSKKVFTEEEVKDIIDSYLNGMPCTKLGVKYSVPHKCILKILHKYNVKVDGNKIKRKYTINLNYFDKIDTSNKAYILGFLYADGSVNYKKATLTMSLQEEDKYILEAIKDEIGSNRPLEYLDYSNKHNFGYCYKNQYRMSIFNKHMVDSLSNIGMVQNKSLVLKFPNIPKELYSHFIRGYFDGDGSFSYYFVKGNDKLQTIITITSTHCFCESIRNILIEELNIPGGGIYEASCKNGITKVLSFGGNEQNKIILDWLYKDAKMFLKRKHDKYINCFYSNNSSFA